MREFWNQYSSWQSAPPANIPNEKLRFGSVLILLDTTGYEWITEFDESNVQYLKWVEHALMNIANSYANQRYEIERRQSANERHGK